jgi:hypothetical protein
MSMLSFAPAARMAGFAGLTARPGSFCLFCENKASLLPTVTSVEPPGVTGAALASEGNRTAMVTADAIPTRRRLERMDPPGISRTIRAGTYHPGTTG